MSLKPLERFFGVVSVDAIDKQFNFQLAQHEHQRQLVRESYLNRIKALDPAKQGDLISAAFVEYDREMEILLDKEKDLRKFVESFK